jgi:hypothetical protein
MRSSKAECDVDEVGHFCPPFRGFYVAVLQRFDVEPLLSYFNWQSKKRSQLFMVQSRMFLSLPCRLCRK